MTLDLISKHPITLPFLTFLQNTSHCFIIYQILSAYSVIAFPALPWKEED